MRYCQYMQREFLVVVIFFNRVVGLWCKMKTLLVHKTKQNTETETKKKISVLRTDQARHGANKTRAIRQQSAAFFEAQQHKNIRNIRSTRTMCFVIYTQYIF